MNLRARGWSLRRYMAGFMVVLLVVAALAALAVRIPTEQDARQAAQADVNFAARAAATEIANELALARQTTDKLAANPQAAVVASAPSGASCTLTFGGGILFTTGHLDIVKSDGTVKCSSRALPSGPVYAAAGWLPDALRSPVTVAPSLAPVTGQISAVVASPIRGGIGVLVAIVELAPVGPGLASSLGGARHLEFLITAADSSKVLARSVEPARWVGTRLADSNFASFSGPVESPGVHGLARL